MVVEIKVLIFKVKRFAMFRKLLPPSGEAADSLSRDSETREELTLSGFPASSSAPGVQLKYCSCPTEPNKPVANVHPVGFTGMFVETVEIFSFN